MFCAMGDQNKALMNCMSSPILINVDTLIKKVDGLEAEGLLDSTENLRDSPVYIFHGKKDSTVQQAVGKKGETMYEHYGVNLKTEYSINAEHGMPTNIESNQACAKNGSPYINYCEYDGAFETLNHISSKAPLNPPGVMNPDNVFSYK